MRAVQKKLQLSLGVIPTSIIAFILLNPIQDTNYTPDLTEIPFWQGFLDSVVTIQSPRFLDQERIIFGDRKDHRIVVVDSKNETVFGIGREGSGPGEFDIPSALAVWPDGKFAVWDYKQFRLSLFDSDFVFNNSLQLEFVSPTSTSMITLEDDLIAIAPGDLTKENTYSGQVLLIPLSFEGIQQIAAPCEPTAASVDNPFHSDFCVRTLGIGSNSTLLIGFHDDYRLHRYSQSGELLWDSGSLDPTFRAIAYRMSDRQEGLMFRSTYNGLECILEIEDLGFAIAGFTTITADQPDVGPVQRNQYFLDLRSEDGQLKHRIIIPDGLQIGDLRQDDHTIYILTYLSGMFDMPTIRLFTVRL